MSKQSDLISVSQGASGDPLFIDTVNDRIGIGTSAPSQKLTIDGTSSGAYIAINNAGSGDISSGLLIYNGANLDASIYTNPTFGNTTILAREAMAFRAGDAERMRIDTAGRVTMPYQPAFRAGRNAGSVASGTIVFNSVFTNIGNHYNSSTGLFTAPVAGRYYFHANIFGENNTSPHVQITKNGVKQVWTLYSGGGYGNVNLSGVIDLATSDTVNVLVDQGNVYGAGGAEDCTFSGFLIG